jgi:hypothetical protein
MERIRLAIICSSSVNFYSKPSRPLITRQSSKAPAQSLRTADASHISCLMPVEMSPRSRVQTRTALSVGMRPGPHRAPHWLPNDEAHSQLRYQLHVSSPDKMAEFTLSSWSGAGVAGVYKVLFELQWNSSSGPSASCSPLPSSAPSLCSLLPFRQSRTPWYSLTSTSQIP